MPSTYGLHGNTLIIYSLLVVDGQDGQHGQKGQPCSCNISIFHNSCKLQLLKITAHALFHQTCMAIVVEACLLSSCFIEDNHKWYHMATSSHICSNCLRASLLNWCTTYPRSMSFQETTSGDGIFLNTQRFCYSDVVDQKLLLGTCTITPKNLGKCYCLWWNIPKRKYKCHPPPWANCSLLKYLLTWKFVEPVWRWFLKTNQTPFVWSFAFQPAGIVNGEPYKGLCKILSIPGPRKLVTGIFLHGLFHG